MAHAVEALYAQDANPVISLLAEQAIASLAQALPPYHHRPADREARADALYGAWACGTCLGSVGMALHHKLCHVLGGSFGLPHAETHTSCCPMPLPLTRRRHPKRWPAWRVRFGVTEAAQGLFDLAGELGAPRSLGEIGMPEGGLDDAADLP